MNIKQLEGLCLLAETQNFSRAAERMYITQPAFSRMIVQLEDELGCKLFIRSKTEPRLTYAGERIYQCAKNIMEQYTQIYGIASIASKNGLGCVRIGVLDGLTETAKNIIQEFQRQFPDVILELKEFTENQMFTALRQEMVDIIIFPYYPSIYRNEFEGIAIEEGRLCAALYEDNPLSKKNSISVEDLKEEPFLVLNERVQIFGHNEQIRLCLQKGFVPKVVAQMVSISNAFAAVDCNLGCLLITDSLRELAGKHTVFVPIEGIEPFQDWVIWRRESHKTEDPAVENFITFMRT